VNAPGRKRRTTPFEQRGDPTRAQRVLGWQPKITFEGLVAAMVDADLAAVRGAFP